MIKSVQRELYFYILLLVAHIGFVWILPYFPSQDGPSHMYNLVILHDLINGGTEWGNFYTYKLRAVPNLGFTILAYPLLDFFSPLVVEKLFISFYIVLMGISVPIFLRTFDRPVFPFAYFVFPVIFNFTLLMGFYSYAITVPLFLCAFSFAWKIRDRTIIYKFLVFNLTGIILFYFHLIPFVLFLVALMITAFLQSSGFKKKISGLLELLIIISPCILNLFLHLAQGTKNYINDFSYLLSSSRYIDLGIDLLTFSTVSLSPWQVQAAFIYSFIFFFFFALYSYRSIKSICENGLQFKNSPFSEKTLVCLTLVLIVIYFLSPFDIGSGSFFNERLPWVILLVALPILKIPDQTIISSRFVSMVMAGIASVFFVFYSIVMWQQSEKIENFLSGLHVEMPKGAFVMIYRTELSEHFRVDVLRHAASYYGIFKGTVDVGNYETSSNLFPVNFKNTVLSSSAVFQIEYDPATTNFAEYSFIQYLLGWDIDVHNRKKLNDFFHVVWEKEQLTVWERNTLKNRDRVAE